MFPIALPITGGPEAVPGVHRYVEDDLGRLRLESSVYDMARATLDRLIARGAFSVDEYEVVRDALVHSPVPAPVFLAVRDALRERVDTAAFHIKATADPETGARQIGIVAMANVTPEEAARVAWDFYRDWLSQQPVGGAQRLTVSVRPAGTS